VYEFEDIVDIELWAEHQLIDVEEDRIKTLEEDIKFFKNRLKELENKLENEKRGTT